MTEVAPRPGPDGAWLGFAARLRRPDWPLVQGLLLVAAVLLAYNGARILNDSPRLSRPNLDNLDTAMPWLGAALLALVIAAWQPRRLNWSPRAWAPALAGFWRAHRVEILLFAAIFAFGVFMRVYRFHGTLPPSEGLCCEEQINGGAAYKALQGQYPLNFLLTRWGAAAGFAVFGENTLGLRFFFPVMGIATLVLFYLLLRQLVRPPAALFGLALYAAAWWPSLRSRQASEGTIYAVLFALLLVRALKSKSPLAALGVGVVAGLLSYEYEPFKVVPIVGALFLGAAAAREVLLRAPLRPDAVRERAGALLAMAWRPALVGLMACGIVLAPLAVGTHKGYDLYLTSVHRQEEDRGGERFSGDWPEQLKWAAEVFLPFGPNEYPTSPPRDMPGTALLDPLSGWLALAGLVAGLAFFLRGFRLYFAGWVVLSVGAAAVLLHDFGAWKFIGLVPVLLVLAAMLIDDLWRLASRRFGERGVRAAGVLLVAGAAFSFWWNADALFNDVAPSPLIAGGYGGEQALAYVVCDELRDRGDDNYSFVFGSTSTLQAFAAPRDTPELAARVWGDFIWACHDLQGTALPAPEEAWPLRPPDEGPMTLVVAGPFGSMDALIEELNRVYPGLGQPNRRVVGPADSYRYITYEFASGNALYRPGLWADYLPPGATAPGGSRVDAVSDVRWDNVSPPLTPPFTVRWRGLVFLDERAALSLRALTDEPVEVRLDGQVVHGTRSAGRQDEFVDLVPGWHAVEIALDKQHDGGSLRLVWATADGTERAVAPADLFPLAELSGWVQQRSVGVPGERQLQVTQRLDFAPHYVSGRVIKLLAQRDTFEPVLTQERWRGVWQVDEGGDYQLRIDFPAGTVTLLADGATVAEAQAPLSGPGQLIADVSLQAGRHTLELVQELDTEVPWAGLVLSVSRVAGDGQLEPAPLRVTPY